jgi:hypothetical protein
MIKIKKLTKEITTATLNNVWNVTCLQTNTVSVTFSASHILHLCHSPCLCHSKKLEKLLLSSTLHMGGRGVCVNPFIDHHGQQKVISLITDSTSQSSFIDT